ncbi:uncharacterized protein LOC131145208 [Malania oleifera]|uniref:uncharacterized protein LOC131145208 n=1 Tax=Malania oleifera TaxID=397392 RepID=UPI0025AE91F6|nr:uncharacterized protein LOC131145208 [Malania oleifera]
MAWLTKAAQSLDQPLRRLGRSQRAVVNGRHKLTALPPASQRVATMTAVGRHGMDCAHAFFFFGSTTNTQPTSPQFLNLKVVVRYVGSIGAYYRTLVSFLVSLLYFVFLFIFLFLFSFFFCFSS